MGIAEYLRLFLNIKVAKDISNERLKTVSPSLNLRGPMIKIPN
jgi:hypothetical protein